MANRAKMRTIEKILALAAMILVSEVWGFGLNNLYGLQTIGSPFYAEIPIQSAPTVSKQCTTIKPIPGDAELFIADLQVDVAGPPNAQRLVISSRSPVRAPLISFVVEVNCPNASMSREYTVLAENPPSRKLTATRDSISAVPSTSSRPQVMAIPTPVGPALANAVATNTLVMPVTTTLNAMARQLYPGDRQSRDAYRAAFAAANPSLFAGVKHVGSVLIAAGTTLQLPAGVAVPPNIPAVAQASRAPVVKAPKISALESALPSGGRDRLTLGVATPQLQMLADAISRIEGMAAERDRVQSELVGGVSGSLNAVIELKNRLAAQEIQMRQLIELQVESERRRVKEKESELGLLGILGLLLSAVALTAGLVILHHFLATRRQARLTDQQRVEPTPIAGAVAERATESAPEAESESVPEPEPVPEPKSEPEADPVPESPTESAPEPASEYVPEYVEYVPVAVAPTNKAADSHGQTESDAEIALPPAASPLASFDDWSDEGAAEPPSIEEPAAAPPEYVLPPFLSTGNEITELADLLRGTENPDPAQCFKLIRAVRAAGLMTDQDYQDVLSKYRRIFNADVMHENDTRGLDAFQRVLAAANKTWGRSDGLTYLSSLIYDDRGGEREGFPEIAFEEILLLVDILTTRIAMFGEDQPAEPVVAPVMFSLELPPSGTSSE